MSVKIFLPSTLAVILIKYQLVRATLVVKFCHLDRIRHILDSLEVDAFHDTPVLYIPDTE